MVWSTHFGKKRPNGGRPSSLAPQGECLCVLGTVRTDLVGAERVRQHVAAARPQHVHLLAHVILQLLKLALGAPDLGLDLSKGPDRPGGSNPNTQWGTKCKTWTKSRPDIDI